ncbi:MAG: GNAT family N-acetyltransferase [bacterium]
MEKLWSVRKYTKEDKELLFKLYEEVWGKEIAQVCRKRWDWKFEDNPNNPKEGPFIRILEYKGQLAGFICGISSKVLINTKTYQAYWLVDHMTHPKYRGRGHLLIKKAYEENPLNIGFPTEPAYLLWKRIAGFDVHISFNPLMKKSVNLENTVTKFVKNKLIAKFITLPLNLLFDLIFKPKKSPLITLTQISSFNSRIDDFWNRISKNFNAISIRDMKYLNWRFVRCPDVQYTIFLAERKKEISGYIVLRVYQNTGYIVDFLAEKEGFESLIWQATKYFKEQKVNSICCLEPKDAFYLKPLKKCGFFVRNDSTVYRFIGRSIIPDVPMEFLREPKNWFLTLGDSDLDMII